jgi:hypothetical protein
MKFAKNQIVRGVAYGRFVVVSSKIREADGCEVVTVMEFGTNGQPSRSSVKLPAECLVAE